MLTNQKIVVLSGQMYQDRYPTCKQNITNELIGNNQVVYVEFNYSWGKFFLGLLGKEDWPVQLLGRTQRVSDNLVILTPPPRIPWRNRFLVLNWLNQKIVAFYLKRLLKKLGFEKIILWSFIHESEFILGDLKERIELSIYHCVDNWPSLIGDSFKSDRSLVIRQEKSLAEKVDLVFATAKSLRDRLVKSNPKTYYIPNAAKIDLFARALDPDLEVPLDINRVPKPVVGFVGSLSHWINLSLLQFLIESRPDWSFVFIGPVSVDVVALKEKPNVHFLGLKKQEQLPAYLKYIDVSIIPFQANELTRDVSPLKLFEYLASGTPVVASCLPEMEDLESSVVKIARDNREFLGLIQDFFLQDLDRLAKAANQLVQEHTWENRVKRYAEIIESI